MGASDAEEVKHSGLGLKDGTATEGADLDGGHGDGDFRKRNVYARHYRGSQRYLRSLQEEYALRDTLRRAQEPWESLLKIRSLIPAMLNASLP